MSITVQWVDGWEVRSRSDGGYGVYDAHGLIEGPFGTKQQALAAAMALPKPRPMPMSRQATGGNLPA